jgi:hypothetical protein
MALHDSDKFHRKPFQRSSVEWSLLDAPASRSVQRQGAVDWETFQSPAHHRLVGNHCRHAAASDRRPFAPARDAGALERSICLSAIPSAPLQGMYKFCKMQDAPAVVTMKQKVFEILLFPAQIDRLQRFFNSCL